MNDEAPEKGFVTKRPAKRFKRVMGSAVIPLAIAIPLWTIIRDMFGTGSEALSADSSKSWSSLAQRYASVRYL